MLLNNELDIDYFQKHKSPTGKNLLTFKGKIMENNNVRFETKSNFIFI